MEANEIIKAEVAALKGAIEERLAKAEALAMDTQKAHPEIKNELANLTTKFNELTGKQQEQLDAISTQMKNARENNEAFDVHRFEKSLKASPNLKQAQNDFTIKAVGDMVSGTQIAAAASRGMIAPGITPVARELTNIRDYFSVIAGTGATFPFMRETGVEGAPATVAQGANAAQTDNDIELVELTHRKIKHYKNVAEELLTDIPALSGFLSTIGVQELMKVEDAQLLAGAGTGTDLTGLSINALTDGNVSASWTNKFALNGSNRWDALMCAIATVAAAKHNVDRIFLNPSDFYLALNEKGTDGHYPLNALVYSANREPIFFGIPIGLSTSVTAGTLYVGKVGAAQIVQRDGLNVRFTDEGRTNRIAGMVTVTFEERLQFPIYYPTAWFVETFANMKLQLENT